MNRLLFIVILFVFVNIGCEFNKTPDYVIPKDKIIDIIVDIHITDGMVTILGVRKDILENYSDSVYNDIFKHHGYTRKDFDTSIYHYSHTINEYDDIYKEVLNKLSEKEALIKEASKENKDERSEREDSQEE